MQDSQNSAIRVLPTNPAMGKTKKDACCGEGVRGCRSNILNWQETKLYRDDFGWLHGRQTPRRN